MPDKHGKFRPVSFPTAPWCPACKLFVCACEPASPAEHHDDAARLYSPTWRYTAEHVHCGTPRCCGTC